ADVAINSAPYDFAEQLNTLAPIDVPRWRVWTTAAREQYEQYTQVPHTGPRHGVDLAVVVRHLAERLPPDTTVCNGAGNFTVWVHRFFTYKQPRTELATICGAMGYGLPAAIAAKLRYPDRL